jgi:predicted secreted protein
MAQASYVKKVEISANGTSNWLPLPCTGPSLSNDCASDDVTTSNSNGYAENLPTLQSWSISCDCIYDPNDAALTLLLASKFNRTILHVRYLPDGTTANGLKGKAIVTSYSPSGEVSGAEKLSITLQGTGQLSSSA